jgi:hypothetical protein
MNVKPKKRGIPKKETISRFTMCISSLPPFPYSARYKLTKVAIREDKTDKGCVMKDFLAAFTREYKDGNFMILYLK